MIPLRDRNPTTKRAWVTYTFIALNILAFLLWQPLGDAGAPSGKFACPTGITTDPAAGCQELAKGDVFVFCHGAIPEEVMDLKADPEIEDLCGEKSVIGSIFSSMFLHGGWLHIAGNLLYLWVFGNNVEDRMGPFAFTIFYLVAGIVAVYAQALASQHSLIPMIGASGAIAGTLGAYLVLFPHARVLTLVPLFFFLQVMELRAIIVLGFWFVLQAFQGVGSLGADTGGVAWWAHIGGFVFGALIGLLYRSRKPQPQPEVFPPY